MNDASLESGKCVKDGFFATGLNLLGEFGGHHFQLSFALFAIVIAVKVSADAIVEASTGDDVDQILSGVKDFALLADQVGGILAIELDGHVAAA